MKRSINISVLINKLCDLQKIVCENIKNTDSESKVEYLSGMYDEIDMIIDYLTDYEKSSK